MMKPKPLVVEDDEDIRVQMKWVVTAIAAQRPVGTLLGLGLLPCPGHLDEGLAVLSELLVPDRRAR